MGPGLDVLNRLAVNRDGLAGGAVHRSRLGVLKLLDVVLAKLRDGPP